MSVQAAFHRPPGVGIADVLARLVEKSLVITDEAASEPRYRMLETVRQYARERLAAMRV
jgi:predicted ATPase